MSSIRANSIIYCPCSSKQVSTSDVLNYALKCHSIHDLYFCPSCQVPKCKFCYRSQLMKKYCVSCMTDYTDSNSLHCMKNCFTCPECESMLAIALSDQELGGKKGKQFHFSCSFCNYTYTTGIITKPKTIFNIVKGEYAHENKLAEYFEDVSHAFKHKAEYEILSEEMIKKIKRGEKYKGAPIDVIAKFKQMRVQIPEDNEFAEIDKLKLLLEENTPEPFNELDDVRKTTLGNIRQPKVTIFKTEYNSNISDQKKVPIPKTLTPIKAHICCDCNHKLLEPTEELLATKFVSKFYANDFIPQISISPIVNQKFPETFEVGKLYIFLVNIVNPLTLRAQVKLLTAFEYEIDGCVIQATLPVPSIEIDGYDPKDHVIRGIPTPYLTKDTKISRAELVMRVGRSNVTRSSDTSVDIMESLVETHDNWCLVPIELVIKSAQEPILALKVPVYAAVKSKIPDAIASLHLSKPALSFGVWTSINLGAFPIESS